MGNLARVLFKHNIKYKVLLIVFLFLYFTVLSKISLLLTELYVTHDSGFLAPVTRAPGREPKYPPYAHAWICADGLGQLWSSPGTTPASFLSLHMNLQTPEPMST